MRKQAALSHFNSLSDLKNMIMMERGIAEVQKREVLRAIEDASRRLGPSISIGQFISSLGGGAVAALLARFVGMGAGGQIIAGAMGYGVGKSIFRLASSVHQSAGYNFNPYKGYT